ncbi:ATP-binding cassette domain-containing protein [Herbidospora yilanensis]|uniref:ATP-binding cassette domain-containing protein n=1 Tax=Herbidospora yilanensis TaxID=354426 RepID=UPI00078565B3|nr:ATP-binding cassette domain-containing protein [Herbidospora yilanensis]
MTDRRTPALRASGLAKSFGHVQALRQGELTVHAGEVVALVGDNGAGKSTLISCVSGALLPDAGEVSVDGRPMPLGSIRAAMEHGIATVYQGLAMAPDLSVAENLFLSCELRRPGLLGRLGLLDKKAMRERAWQLMDGLGITTLQDVTLPVGDLSGGQRQVVAVARAVSRAGRLVIMDEPTAALGARQSQMVIETIKATRDRGLGVVLISHDLPRVLEVADRIVIMRLGRVVADLAASGLKIGQIVALMLGERDNDREEGLPA